MFYFLTYKTLRFKFYVRMNLTINLNFELASSWYNKKIFSC